MILDTNALSALANGDSGLEKFLQSATEVAIPVIALGEWMYGIRFSKFRREYVLWWESNRAAFTILEVNQDTISRYAGVRELLKKRGKPIPENDVWIAAITLQHKSVIVSRDAHFDNVDGLKRAGW